MCGAIVPYQEPASKFTGHDAVTDWASSSSPPRADKQTVPESLSVVAGAARQPVRAYETFERRDHRTPRYASNKGGAATPRSYVDLDGCARARVLKMEVRVYTVLEPDVKISLHDGGRGNVALTDGESQQLKAAAEELRCAMDQRRMILRAAHTELDRQSDLVLRCEREAARLDKLYGEVEELERKGMEEEDSRPMVDALCDVGGRGTGNSSTSTTTSTTTSSSSSSSSNNNHNKANSYNKYYSHNNVDNKSHDDNNNNNTSANDAGDEPFIRWGTYAGRVFAVKVTAPLAFTYSSGACSISVLDAAMDDGEISCGEIVRLACETAAQEAALHRYHGLLEEEHAKPVFEQTQKVEAELKRLKALTDKMYTKIAKITVAFKWRQRSLKIRQRIYGTAHTNAPLHGGPAAAKVGVITAHEGATVQPEVPSQLSGHASAASEQDGRYVQAPLPSPHTSGTSDINKSTPAPTLSTQGEANISLRHSSTASALDASGSSTGLTSRQKENQQEAAGEQAAAMQGRCHSDQKVGEEILAVLAGGCTVHDAGDLLRRSSQCAQHEIVGQESKPTSTPLTAVDTSAATCLAHMGKRFFALLFRGRDA